jgi:hypothetical protein
MSSSIVAPVVPSGAARHPAQLYAGRAGRRALPLAALPIVGEGGVVYGMAAVDTRGRIADHQVMAVLGWSAGTRLDIREGGGLIVVRADRQGVFSVTSQGHLRLPITVRQWCGLAPGDRVLLVAEHAHGRLVVHPPATLDVMVTGFQQSVLGGETA